MWLRKCQAKRAGDRPLRGDSGLTSALPSWSTQHNPVCEHLHCLNFIPWWCLLIGQAWLTASGLQSDRQEQAGPQPRIHSGRQRGDLGLGMCGSDLQMSAARPGAGLGVGGPRKRLGGVREEGRWDRPSHPNDQASGVTLAWTISRKFFLTIPCSSYLRITGFYP